MDNASHRVINIADFFLVPVLPGKFRAKQVNKRLKEFSI